jgi:ribosome maturation factor RimP
VPLEGGPVARLFVYLKYGFESDLRVDVIAKITQAIEPSLESMGYSLVLLKLAEGSGRRTLMVMAERTDDTMMSFDDCTEITRTVSALLDVEDPITGAYDLEVCSPGIDRPLTRPEHFTRFTGYEAKIETMLPVEGRKRFRGIVDGMEKDKVMVTLPEGMQFKIPVANIKTAKLVLTDALMAEALKK